MPETVRTFIAIELPEEVRAYLGRCQETLGRTTGEVRWVRPEHMHLTLVFLGNVPADRLDDVAAAVREACAGFAPLRLQAGGIGCFPPKGKPRVVWCGIVEATGELVRLQESIAIATADFAEKPEGRDYQAHLTLGRVRGRGGNLWPLSEAAGRMAGDEGPSFEASEVLVIRSDLGPGGPKYTLLDRAALTG